MSDSKAAQVWMVIASGGKWEPSELRLALPALSEAMVMKAVHQLVGSDMVTLYDDGRYGVTHDCRIPHGMSIGEVLKVMGVAA